ncbi:multidrug resistance protein MdtB [Helicobacter pylori SS1]|nr:multidrug resistance protein MdtB [Helicobacter pylori SS1]
MFAVGEYISVPASVGFIALFGIAVLNGVVMIGYFKELLLQGKSVEECVLLGAKRRLRPVLMTACIAGLGLIPLLFSHSVGSEVQKPLAIVVLGGLVTSSALTLLLLPPMFMLIAKKIKIN